MQDSFTSLSVSQIKEHQVKVDKQFVPFAIDMDGTLMCVDRSNNNVVIWDSDDQSVEEDLKMTLGQYLESFRNKILMGTLVYA